jgi:hypothetical protein
MRRLSNTPVVGRRLQETKVEILPTASRRVRGCVVKEPTALKATLTARRNRRSESPHHHYLLNLLLLLWAGTPVETAGRNLVLESAERPHLRAFRDLRNTSAQTPNSHLQTATHTLTFGVIERVSSCTVVIRDTSLYSSDRSLAS